MDALDQARAILRQEKAAEARTSLTVAWLPVRFHLHVLDRAFLKLGMMDRLRAYVRQKEEKEKTGSAAA